MNLNKQIANVEKEIQSLLQTNPGLQRSGILVSYSKTDGAVWGEIMALPRAEMEAATADIGYTTDGMIDALEFEYMIAKWAA